MTGSDPRPVPTHAQARPPEPTVKRSHGVVPFVVKCASHADQCHELCRWPRCDCTTGCPITDRDAGDEQR